MSRYAALLGIAFLGFAFLQEASGLVTRVVDGDTIEVEIEGDLERVRYIGIDTPELTDERSDVRELARQAAEANADLVRGRRVQLELDVNHRDRYGRLLAYVWVGDTLVNEFLVRSGHASPYTYPPNVKYVSRFAAAARDARARDGTKLAELPSGTISASEATSYIGEYVIVCGFVASTRRLTGGRQPTFLNLDMPYPDQALTVVIWGDSRDQFSESPEVAFAERGICVSGQIQLYRGRPQVVVDEPAQIRLRNRE